MGFQSQINITLLVIALLVLFVFGCASATRAQAADLECLSPALDQANWDIQSGTARYCSPILDTDGIVIPDDYLMDCTMTVDGAVYDVQKDLPPGTVVTVTAGSFRYGHPVELFCTNASGSSVVLAVAGRFPAQIPNGPTLLD